MKAWLTQQHSAFEWCCCSGFLFCQNFCRNSLKSFQVPQDSASPSSPTSSLPTLDSFQTSRHTELSLGHLNVLCFLVFLPLLLLFLWLRLLLTSLCLANATPYSDFYFLVSLVRNYFFISKKLEGLLESLNFYLHFSFFC